MRYLLIAATLIISTPAAADGITGPTAAPCYGYRYQERYQEYGRRPTAVVPPTVVHQHYHGPVFVTPPPGLYGPPISARRYYRQLDRGIDPYYNYPYYPPSAYGRY